VAEADRLRAEYAEAERLMREAAEKAGMPPRGWSVPGGDRPSQPFPDLSQLAGLVESLRGAVPPELTRQLADALRDLLLALRAILDWYISRLERPEAERSEVRDIPIE
jgi:hypothetical protein